MQFSMRIEDLKRGLGMVKDTVGRGDHGSLGIRIYATAKTNKIKLTTTDGYNTTETWIHASVKKGGKGLIGAKKFLSYISKLDAEKGTFTLKENGSMMIKSKRGQQTFAGMDVDTFTIPKKSESKAKWSMAGRIFKQLVNGVSFAAGEIVNMPILEGINILSDGKHLEMTTTNTQLIAHYKKRVNAPTLNITVPRKSIVNAAKYLKDDEKVSLELSNDTRFIIKVADTSYHMPLLEGKYPNLRDIIPTSDFPLEFVVEKSEILGVLDRAVSMLDTKGILQFEKGKVILSGKTEESDFSEYIMTKLQGKAKSIRVDLKNMLDIIKNIDADNIFVGVRERQPLTIRPDTKQAQTCLLTIAES